VKSRSLQDLGALRKTIQERAKAAEALRQRELEAQRRAEAEQELFSRAVGQVRPLSHAPRVRLHHPPAAPTAFQQQRDDAAVLRESLSDEFDISTLLDTDDQLSFRQPGIGTDVTRKLRRGAWSIQGQVDLHGLRSEEARDTLSQFVRDALRMGWRCVRVVHGKGLGSPGKTPVLKSKVQRWLVQKSEVQAFVQAPPAQGGAGALLVLLKGSL
jgi:DNA-nicking Smr family endonuclease